MIFLVCRPISEYVSVRDVRPSEPISSHACSNNIVSASNIHPSKNVSASNVCPGKPVCTNYVRQSRSICGGKVFQSKPTSDSNIHHKPILPNHICISKSIIKVVSTSSFRPGKLICDSNAPPSKHVSASFLRTSKPNSNRNVRPSKTVSEIEIETEIEIEIIYFQIKNQKVYNENISVYNTSKYIKVYTIYSL